MSTRRLRPRKKPRTESVVESTPAGMDARNVVTRSQKAPREVKPVVVVPIIVENSSGGSVSADSGPAERQDPDFRPSLGLVDSSSSSSSSSSESSFVEEEIHPPRRKALVARTRKKADAVAPGRGMQGPVHGRLRPRATRSHRTPQAEVIDDHSDSESSSASPASVRPRRYVVDSDVDSEDIDSVTQQHSAGLPEREDGGVDERGKEEKEAGEDTDSSSDVVLPQRGRFRAPQAEPPDLTSSEDEGNGRARVVRIRRRKVLREKIVRPKPTAPPPKRVPEPATSSSDEGEGRLDAAFRVVEGRKRRQVAEFTGTRRDARALALDKGRLPPVVDLTVPVPRDALPVYCNVDPAHPEDPNYRGRDPVTCEALHMPHGIQHVFIEAVGVDGEVTRICYNGSTLRSIARHMNRWTQPPDFRRPMTKKLKKQLRSIHGKDFLNLNEADEDDIDDLDFEQQPGLWPDLLTQFVGPVSQQNLYICPVCYRRTTDPQYRRRARGRADGEGEGRGDDADESGEDAQEWDAVKETDDPLYRVISIGMKEAGTMAFPDAADWREHLSHRHWVQISRTDESHMYQAEDYKLKQGLIYQWLDTDDKAKDDHRKKITDYWWKDHKTNRITYNALVDSVLNNRAPEASVLWGTDSEREESGQSDDFIDDAAIVEEESEEEEGRGVSKGKGPRKKRKRKVRLKSLRSRVVQSPIVVDPSPLHSPPSTAFSPAYSRKTSSVAASPAASQKEEARKRALYHQQKLKRRLNNKRAAEKGLKLVLVDSDEELSSEEAETRPLLTHTQAVEGAWAECNSEEDEMRDFVVSEEDEEADELWEPERTMEKESTTKTFAQKDTEMEAVMQEAPEAVSALHSSPLKKRVVAESGSEEEDGLPPLRLEEGSASGADKGPEPVEDLPPLQTTLSPAIPSHPPVPIPPSQFDVSKSWEEAALAAVDAFEKSQQSQRHD